jgi:hypothetical protein
MIRTFHTYPDLLIDGGRLAATDWAGAETIAEAIAATIRQDPAAVILSAIGGGQRIAALAPGGMA